MLRLNLLRTLTPSPPGPGQSGDTESVETAPGPLRPVLLILLGLLVLGAVSLYLAKPAWLNLDALSGIGARTEAARADSLRRVETLRADASRLVAHRQSLAIEWLDQLEATVPMGTHAPIMTLSSFTASGAFILRGTAGTAEVLSALQEALVLIPGMDLRESRAEELGETRRTGFSFVFSGSVTLPPDTSSPAGNRVIPAEDLEKHLTVLVESAALEGLDFSQPEAGTVIASGILRLHPYRLSGSFKAPDSAAFSVLRSVLTGERHRGSPFGVQRVTMENRSGQRTVSLDIMAFTP
jgi:hypothetical protein